MPVDVGKGVLFQYLLDHLLLLVVAHHLNLKVLLSQYVVALILGEVVGVDTELILSDCLGDEFSFIFHCRLRVLLPFQLILQILPHHYVPLERTFIDRLDVGVVSQPHCFLLAVADVHAVPDLLPRTLFLKRERFPPRW